MAPSLNKVFFDLQNIDTDTITEIGGLSPASPIVSETLVDNNPQFWIEQDTNGKDFLCTSKIQGAPLSGTFMGGEGAYELTAQNFQVVDVIGGHPVSKPGGKGG